MSLLSQPLRRAIASGSRAQPSASLLPPTFLLPFRARISTTPSSTSTDPPVTDLPLQKKTPKTPTPTRVSTQQTPPVPSTPSLPKSKLPSPPPEPTGPLPASVVSQLPLLSLQSGAGAGGPGPGLYATVHVHGRPYLVTAGDRVRLPFLMGGVRAGDVLRLTRASTLGSRDYTLRGEPWVDGRLFECRAVVAGVESEPMRIMEKTKRRNRRVRRVRSKHKYTEIIVSELVLKHPDPLADDAMPPADEAKA